MKNLNLMTSRQPRRLKIAPMLTSLKRLMKGKEKKEGKLGKLNHLININMATIQNCQMKIYFLYVNGEVKFEEIDKGMIICGGCGNMFARIVGHLTKNPSCSQNVSI